MQNYIKNINYLNQELTEGEIVYCETYSRLLIDENHPSYADSKNMFSQEKYKYPYLPLYLGQYEIENVENIDVNVLRLLIRLNDEKAPLHIPAELMDLEDFLLDNINYHRQHYSENKNAFIYLTVRICDYENIYYDNSKTWHIDGFQGSKIKRHIVEQNVIWSNKCPTEFLLQPMFCEGLNPSRHDINDFFDRNAKEEFRFKSLENGLYFMNPYNIHRVNSEKFEGKRVFIRLNFSPVEISDKTNTVNPMLKREVIKSRDVRDFLNSYVIDEIEASGFRK